MGNMARTSNPVLAADSDIQLHVEGITDVQIIDERWLERHPDLRRAFSEIRYCVETPSDTSKLERGPSGCQALLQRLAESLSQTDVIAMGLADRDLLLDRATMEIFLEPDDAAFIQLVQAHFQDLGGRLWVLPRWEIENYLLLDLDLLAVAWRDNAKSNPEEPPTDTTVNGMATALIALADEATPLAAAALANTRLGEPLKAVPGINDARGRSVMKARVTAAYADLPEEAREAEERKIEAFNDPSATSLPERWDRLSRVVDGKWILGRISKRWLKWDRKQLRLNLASNQALKMRGPPAEIVDLFTRMRTSAKEIGQRKLQSPA